MKEKVKPQEPSTRLLIKKCHMCGTIIESTKEIARCPKCNKSFLPLNYFSKCQRNYDQSFSRSDELSEEDLIKGIHVLW